MMDISEQEMSWIRRHLGHSRAVHDTYYRTMSSVLEKGKIAKLLMLADDGNLGQYSGRSLDSIRYDGELVWTIYVYIYE